MTHDQASAVLLDLAYGELEPGVARDVSGHAAGCAECTATLEQIAAVRDVAAGLREAAPGWSSREHLLREARRRASRRGPGRWLGRPAVLAFATAASVVLVAGITLKLTRDDLGEAAPQTPLREAPARAAAPPSPPTSPARPSVAVPAPAREVSSAPPSKRSTRLAPSPGAAPGTVEGPTQERVEQPPVAAAARPAPRAAPASQDELAERRVPGVAEERHQLRCGDLLVERWALVAPGGRVVRLTERRGDAVVEGRYDEAGHLLESSGRATARSGLPQPALPPIAPTLEALRTRCSW